MKRRSFDIGQTADNIHITNGDENISSDKSTGDTSNGSDLIDSSIMSAAPESEPSTPSSSSSLLASPSPSDEAVLAAFHLVQHAT